MVQPSSKPSAAVSAIISTPPETATPYWPQAGLEVVCQLPAISAAENSTNNSPQDITTRHWPRLLLQRGKVSARVQCPEYLGKNTAGKNKGRKRREILDQFIAQRSLQMAVACVCVCVCVCVFFFFLPIHSGRQSLLDVLAGVTREEGHTEFPIHLPSAARAFIFLAREGFSHSFPSSTVKSNFVY